MVLYVLFKIWMEYIYWNIEVQYMYIQTLIYIFYKAERSSIYVTLFIELQYSSRVILFLSWNTIILMIFSSIIL